MSDFIHLRRGGVSLLLDALQDDGALPAVVHWGPDLGTGGDLAALATALVPAVPHSGLRVPARPALLPAGADGWRLRPGLRGARADGTDWSPRFARVDLTLEYGPDGSAAGIVVTGADVAAGLTVTISLRLHPSGVLEIRQALTNAGGTLYLLGELAVALPLPTRATEILDLTGRWARESSPQRHALPQGSWVREGRHGRPGHDTPLVLTAGVPGFAFRTGEVWAAHLGWSGDGVYFAERAPDGTAQLGAAEMLAPGEVVLAPGERYTAPSLFATYSDAGLDGLGRAFHAYVRARPGHPVRSRPVVLNTWEAVYFDHDLDRLRALADLAGALGVERFVLDDGWFGSRRDDTSGLGDWQVSADAWPGGLGPLIDHVRAKGMEFGLWVEPEMVNPDSDLFRAHPDWILSAGGRTPPDWRNQQVLDLVNPEAYEYILGRLDDLLATHDIAFLKWDHNRDLIDAGHAGRPGVRAQTLAVYRLLDTLRSRHPGVEIENCASGGGRVDLGMLARTDRIWPSDTIDSLERQSILRWTGLLVPPELVGTHVGAARAHTTGRVHTLSFRLATALFGHFGIEWDLAAASENDRAALADAIAFYRRVRAMLHHGDVVHADHPDPAVYVHGVVAADRREALYAYVQLTSSVAETPAPVLLPGLDDDRWYEVRPVSLAGGPETQQKAPPPWLAAPYVQTGRMLRLAGVRVPVLRPEQAFLMLVTPGGER
jgi:alpha-galactosidase